MSQNGRPRRDTLPGGPLVFDEVDRRILHILQHEADRPIAAVAEEVGLSATPCWRRIKRLEDARVIRARVALVDQKLVNMPMTVFINVKVPRHARTWLTDFKAMIDEIPEITEAYRLAGDTDYILKIVVPDIASYDIIYNRMIERMEFASISAAISMEELKFTTAIPVGGGSEAG